MANTKAGALTVCPFYLCDDKLTITCEGLAPGNRIQLVFHTIEQRREWQEKKCYLYRCDCPLRKMLNGKYE